MSIARSVATQISSLNLVGLALRGASMVGKFILILALTNQEDLSNVGIFGLFVTSVAFLNYFQGFEFHAYSGRELLRETRRSRSSVIGNQCIVHLLTYIIVLPLSLMVFLGDFLSWEYLGLFYCVAITCHLGQEIQRLLIIFNDVNRAYVVTFLIHGCWAYSSILYIVIYGDDQALKAIFTMWAVSSFIGVALGARLLCRHGVFGSDFFALDFNWVSQGLKVSYKFFVGAAAYKVIEISDRYFIKFFHGDSQVGLYTFYSSIANITQEIVLTGIVVLVFPGLVSNYSRKNWQEYMRLRLKLKLGVVYGSVVSAVVATFILLLVIYQLDRDILSENITTFVVLLSGSVVLNLSLIPHYGLYVRGRDGAIMWSVLTGMGLNVVLNFLLIPTHSIFGASVATLVSVVVVAVLKVYFSSRSK